MPRKIAFFRKLPAFRAARRELTAGQVAQGYALAAGIFGVALILRFWLDPILPPGFPFLTFFPALVIAGFLFGVGPGALAAVLGGLAAWRFFIASEGDPFSAGALMAMALYVFVALTDLFLLSLMISAYRSELRVRRDLERMAEEREMLTGELEHRLKNVFATVSAVITLSERHATGAGDLARKLKDRLSAMARSSLLLRGNAAGQAEQAMLRDVIQKALSPFGASDGQRFSLDGPSIVTAGQAAVILSLILHELGTNAAKHGALSSDRGRVTITWRKQAPAEEGQDTCLEIIWRENRGPRPAADPQRKGFGSTLIDRIITVLDGEAAIDFPASGAVARLTIPLHAIERTATEADEPATA